MALPTITTGPEATATSISSATDVAGTFSVTTKATAGHVATINFGYSYNDIGSGLSACQVILTPSIAPRINQNDIDKFYISATTTTGFSVATRGTPLTSAHTFNYHIIETQSGNGTGTFGQITKNGRWSGVTVTVTQGTDVAGRITTSTPAAPTNGSISMRFGYDYNVAPIVVLQPYDTGAAQEITRWWVTSTTTGLTINFGTGITAKDITLAYHCIETQ